MRAEEPGRDRDEDRAELELEFDSGRAIPFGETIVLERRFPRGFRAVALAIPRELGLAFEVVDVRNADPERRSWPFRARVIGAVV